MKILIVAGREDFHALAVEHALREKGHAVHRLASDTLTHADTLSVQVGARGLEAALDLDGTDLPLDTIDVVWNRRPYEPIQAGPVAEDDAPFVRREIMAAREGLYRLLAQARWVNPLASIAPAENKIHQLACAVQAGFRIPDTLVSNDPDRVRAFLRRHGDCIYKPLHGHVWLQQGRRRATYTAPVQEDDLPADALLRAAPGIYQRRIRPAYEVRAQFFGVQCAAIKIDVSGYGCADWRLAQKAIERCDPARLPEALQTQCLALMARLGLVCAGFDFLVGQDGAWTFLEANQAGQFLFLEDWCPELPVLDMFCGLLAEPSRLWRYRPGEDVARFAQFAQAYLNPAQAPA